MSDRRLRIVRQLTEKPAERRWKAHRIRPIAALMVAAAMLAACSTGDEEVYVERPVEDRKSVV